MNYRRIVLLVCCFLLPLLTIGARPAGGNRGFRSLALTEQQKAEVREKYGTGEVLFKDLPRPFGTAEVSSACFRLFSEMMTSFCPVCISQIPDSSDGFKDYALGLVVYAAVPAAIAVFSLIGGVIHCICRW